MNGSANKKKSRRGESTNIEIKINRQQGTETHKNAIAAHSLLRSVL